VGEWQDIEEDDDAIADASEEQMNTIGEPTSVVHESPPALTYHVEGASGVPRWRTAPSDHRGAAFRSQDPTRDSPDSATGGTSKQL
jgi:hypothetical protein